MMLDEVARTSAAVAGTSKRLEKRELLADLLRRAPAEDLPVVVTYLAGELRQRRTGVGWASLGRLPTPAQEPSLQVAAVDAEFERLAGLSGPGSQTERRTAVAALFAAATADEHRLLAGLIAGELRQGALDAAILDAVAHSTGVPLAALRRASMLRGSTAPVAVAALTEGADAVAAFTMAVGQPVRPMLASSAPDVAAAIGRIEPAGWVVDTKLDGIRVQAHKTASGVRLFTRSLDDITTRLPDVADIVAGLPAAELILDGEVLATDDGGRARAFQDTAARTATQANPGVAADQLVPAFFDVLHVDGEDLIDLPLGDRLARLDALVPEQWRIRRFTGDDPEQAAAFAARVVADGHEGVVVKALDATYEAGRRGSGWIKVKPRHTLDLVVLAVEWGSGRRTGLLSNIHLGARDPATGEFVMVGKTFKGMTDAMLAWQTERFTELAIEPPDRSEWVVPLRPVQVVEIAVDGVQRSTRYPGKVALRFARVLRYREDKSTDEADTIETVRAIG